MNLNEKEVKENLELQKTSNDKKVSFLSFITQAQKILSFISVVLFIVLLIFSIVLMRRSFKEVDTSSLQQQFLVKENKLTLDDFVGYGDIKTEIGKLVSFAKGKIDDSSVTRGILLYGPPGTGKTFLIKCLAGDVKNYASFYSLSGSSLQSKYVGVGAEKVRNLFASAKANAKLNNQKTYFIFIDEIDVIGKKRTSDDIRRNDDSILNELLVQLDGFQVDQKPDDPKLVFLASTNREDLLDEALIRAGRLGKKIKIDYPDEKMIEEIINHLIDNGKDKISNINVQNIFNSLTDKQQEIKKLSKRICQFNFTAAKIVSFFKELNSLISNIDSSELENKRKTKDNQYFIDKIYDAIEIVALGPKNSSLTTEVDDHKIIIHELGHAFFAWKNDYQVYRISLEQRSNIKGYTISFPKIDNSLKTKKDLLNDIKVALGGRCFEQLCYGFNDYTIGASNDFEKAYNIANIMVTKLGMSINESKMTELETKLKNNQYVNNAKLLENEDFQNIILSDQYNYLKTLNEKIQESIVRIIKFCYYSNMIDFFEAINFEAINEAIKAIKSDDKKSDFINVPSDYLISGSFREALLNVQSIKDIMRKKDKINQEEIEKLFRKFFNEKNN